MSTRVVSRLEARTWDWSKCQFDPWTNPWWANRQLDILHWLKKPRPSAAPTPAELRELMEDQQLKLKLTTGMATRNGELPLGTLEKIVGGARTPTYPTLVKACAAVGIELTVTSPGGRFPERLPADDARPAPGVLEARAPSPDDLRTMIEARVDALRNLRITPPRIARYREGVNSHSFKRIRDGEMPTYETLRTLLAAIELDLVIRPAGDPLPEELRHARFTTESEIPVVHIEQHDSGTTVEGHAIDWASAPADLEDPGRLLRDLARRPHGAVEHDGRGVLPRGTPGTAPGTPHPRLPAPGRRHDDAGAEGERTRSRQRVHEIRPVGNRQERVGT